MIATPRPAEAFLADPGDALDVDGDDRASAEADPPTSDEVFQLLALFPCTSIGGTDSAPGGAS